MWLNKLIYANNGNPEDIGLYFIFLVFVLLTFYRPAICYFCGTNEYKAEDISNWSPWHIA